MTTSRAKEVIARVIAEQMTTSSDEAPDLFRILIEDKIRGHFRLPPLSTKHMLFTSDMVVPLHGRMLPIGFWFGEFGCLGVNGAGNHTENRGFC